MTRYVKQKDSFRCGPVAILNALKWAGIKVSYDSFINCLTLLCLCTPSRGTKHGDFDLILRGVGEGYYTVKRIYRPKLNQIEKHLKSGGAVILNYRIHRDSTCERRHFQFTIDTDRKGEKFKIANIGSKKAVCTISRLGFKNRFLRFQRTDKSFKGWFLTKIDNPSNKDFNLIFKETSKKNKYKVKKVSRSKGRK